MTQSYEYNTSTTTNIVNVPKPNLQLNLLVDGCKFVTHKLCKSCVFSFFTLSFILYVFNFYIFIFLEIKRKKEHNPSQQVFETKCLKYLNIYVFILKCIKITQYHNSCTSIIKPINNIIHSILPTHMHHIMKYVSIYAFATYVFQYQ